MAKATGIFGQYSGKLANTVGYILKNSNNKQTQGVRAYQPVVSNPQSLGQCNMRIALLPLNSFARQLKAIIERGFEGVDYGYKSRQKFMQINMKSYDGPYVTKGTSIVVPGGFTISKGSIAPVTVTGALASNRGAGVATDLSLNLTGSYTTYGGFWQGIIDGSPNSGNAIQSGDQLTVVLVLYSGGKYSYMVRSWIVDPTDTTSLTAEKSQNVIQPIHSNSDTVANFGIVVSTAALVAGAVIVSREGDTGHLRSTATMWWNSTDRLRWQTAARYEAAVASYQSSSTRAIDWPVEEEDSDVILKDVFYQGSWTTAGMFASGSTASDEFNSGGYKVKAYVTASGGVGFYLYLDSANGPTDYYLIDENGDPIISNGDTASPISFVVKPSGLAAAGYSYTIIS